MKNTKLLAIIISAIIITACTQTEEKINSVTEDVLFIVLGKMSLYNQSSEGEIELRDHHFVAEIMPNDTGEILGGTLTSKDDSDLSLPFNAEGRAFLAHGIRAMTPEELHNEHDDGTYLFSYATKQGEMKNQPLTLKKRETTEIMPAPAILTLTQNDLVVHPENVNPEQDLTISWTPMKGNMKSPDSELADLIFALGFDCFGNNIAHSGRPYQGTPFLTYEDTSFTIPANSLVSGMKYMLIVEQATADTERYQGVPGIATYATLTFLDAKTTGKFTGETACPAN